MMNDLISAAEKVLDWWQFSQSQLEAQELMDNLSIELEKVRKQENESGNR